jgi:hypothetical protein
MTTAPSSESTLHEELKGLHAQLWWQLQWSDTEEVLLWVLKKCTELLERHVSVPEHNSSWETVRTRVFDAYTRLARVLGRNSPEAIKADTKQMLIKLTAKVEYKNPPWRKPKGVLVWDPNMSVPVQHIENVVTPYLELIHK